MVLNATYLNLNKPVFAIKDEIKIQILIDLPWTLPWPPFVDPVSFDWCPEGHN